MIRFLKVVVSLVILVCVFMPISQCTYKSKPVVSESGEVLKQSEEVTQNNVLSDTFFNDDDLISFTDSIYVFLFFLPLFLTLLSSFNGWKRIFKLSFQSILSAWLVYSSYMVVFGLYSPLLAGWVLCIACVLFFALTSLEWRSIKHDKPGAVFD